MQEQMQVIGGLVVAIFLQLLIITWELDRMIKLMKERNNESC